MSAPENSEPLNGTFWPVDTPERRVRGELDDGTLVSVVGAVRPLPHFPGAIGGTRLLGKGFGVWVGGWGGVRFGVWWVVWMWWWLGWGLR
jgi:hypothetical protein